MWLGDLNYRLSSSCSDVSVLLQKNDWVALLEKDELKIEQKSGRIFTGWHEGRTHLPPTYRYLTNPDRYAVQTEETRERRTPAWCDQILGERGGDGTSLLRRESMFSDHRPVYSIFLVQLSRVEHNDIAAPSGTAMQSKSGRRKKFYKLRLPARSNHRREASNDHSSSSSTNSSSRVQAGEMFPITRTENCTEISR